MNFMLELYTKYRFEILYLKKLEKLTSETNNIIRK